MVAVHIALMCHCSLPHLLACKLLDAIHKVRICLLIHKILHSMEELMTHDELNTSCTRG